MAIEDAAVLGALLAHLRHIDQLPKLLYGYQELRSVLFGFDHGIYLTQRI